MSTDWSTTDDQALRERAVKRLKKQRDFRIHLLMYVLINGLLVVIWAMTGGEVGRETTTVDFFDSLVVLWLIVLFRGQLVRGSLVARGFCWSAW